MNAYVASGWGATFVVVILYAWRTVRRGKVLGRTLPADEKTWR